MTVEAKCLCGQKVRIDNSKPDAKAACPMCGRMVSAPPPPKPKPVEPVRNEDPLAGLSQPVAPSVGYEEYEDKTKPNLIAGAAIGIVVLLLLVGFAVKYALDSAMHTSSSMSGSGSNGPSGPITFGDVDSNGHGTGTAAARQPMPSSMA